MVTVFYPHKETIVVAFESKMRRQLLLVRHIKECEGIDETAAVLTFTFVFM
jgi:hypothetical protein